MGGEIVELTTRDQLKNYLKKNKIVIVKVSATWCSPCQKIKSLVNACHEEISKEIKMVLVDKDKGSDISSLLKVRSVPYLVNFVNGEQYDICTSSRTEEIISFFKSTHDRYVIEFANNLSTMN
jgi:thioredoxin 1